MSGERIPPSAMNPLKSRNGAELACAQPGPSAIRENGRPQFSKRLSEFLSTHAWSVWRRAEVRCRRGDFVGAEQDYERAAGLQSADTWIYLSRALHAIPITFDSEIAVTFSSSAQSRMRSATSGSVGSCSWSAAIADCTSSLMFCARFDIEARPSCSWG